MGQILPFNDKVRLRGELTPTPKLSDYLRKLEVSTADPEKRRRQRPVYLATDAYLDRNKMNREFHAPIVALGQAARKLANILAVLDTTSVDPYLRDLNDGSSRLFIPINDFDGHYEKFEDQIRQFRLLGQHVAGKSSFIYSDFAPKTLISDKDEKEHILGELGSMARHPVYLRERRLGVQGLKVVHTPVPRPSLIR